jgi:integrase
MKSSLKKTAPNLITAAQFARILSHTPLATFRVLLLLLWDTGMRVGEALPLRRVQFSRRGNGGGAIELGPDRKTGRARTVFLTRRAAKALESLPDRGPYFFCGRDGEPLGYTYLYRIFAVAVKRAKVPWAPGLHTLRKSAFYRMTHHSILVAK